MSTTANLIYGGEMMVFIANKPIAFSTSAKLSVSTKTRDASNKDSANWEEKLAGRMSWNMSTDALVNFTTMSGTTTTAELYSAFLSGSPVNVVFGVKTGSSPAFTVDSGKKNFSGSAIITSIDMTAGDGETATYSVSFEGCGALTMS